MKIGVWSSRYDLSTGQAIVTRRVVEDVLPRIGLSQEYIFLPKGGPVAISSWLIVVLRLWIDIISLKIDAIYLVCSRSNLGFIRDIPALLASKAGLQVVVHCHGSDILTLLCGRRLSMVARWFYRSSHVIVPSEHLRSQLIPYVRSVQVCENFYSGTTTVLDMGENIEGKDLTVFWNSNIMASKGFFDVFAAVMALRAEGILITLISIGAPMADEELELDTLNERFAALGKPDWFDYRGRLSHERAIECLQKADVVCLPSRYRSECQPVAIIEAMCSGKPLIVSDTAPLRATVADYPAVFVPVNSVDAISSVLREMAREKVHDPRDLLQARLQFAAKARKRFSSLRFDSEMKSALTALFGS